MKAAQEKKNKIKIWNWAKGTNTMRCTDTSYYWGVCPWGGGPGGSGGAIPEGIPKFGGTVPMPVPLGFPGCKIKRKFI